MKRLQMLLVPLFAMPFLTGCKFGNLEGTRALVFDCTYCVVIDEKGVEHTDLSVLCNIEKTYKYTLKADDGYHLSENDVEFIDSDTEKPFTGEHSFNVNNGEVSVKLTSNIRIIAIATNS